MTFQKRISILKLSCVGVLISLSGGNSTGSGGDSAVERFLPDRIYVPDPSGDRPKRAVAIKPEVRSQKPDSDQEKADPSVRVEDQSGKEPISPPTPDSASDDPEPREPAGTNEAQRPESLQSILERARMGEVQQKPGGQPDSLPVIRNEDITRPDPLDPRSEEPVAEGSSQEDAEEMPPLITGNENRSTEGRTNTPTLATGPREAIPNPDEDLAFPLTLTIPGFDPASGTVTDSETHTNADTGERSDTQTPPPDIPQTDPSLLYAAPFAVGVGATLGEESDVYVDALVPFWQAKTASSRTIAFLVPRLTSGEEASNGSLGIGFRHLNGQLDFLGRGFPWIIGTNIFYDFTNSPTHSFDYQQFGAGLEWMSPYIDLRINAYFPESTRNQIDETSSSSTSQRSRTSTETSYGNPFATGHTIVQPFTTTTTTITRRTTTTRFFEQYETALEGYDAEAGFLLPPELTFFPVRLYGGYYSFDNPYGEDIAGPKARVEVRPLSFLLLDASWYDDAELLGSEWYLGARADILIGGGRRPPSSSKPLHDTAEGPKTKAYNPWGDFNRRLVERIPRNYRAILIETPFIENESRRQIRSSTSTNTSTETGTDLIAADLIFVDASRGALAAPGTWENPRNTIQGGANLAVANLGSTGRIWTVWTQGGVGPYDEDVTVTDSVRFTSNAIPIPAKGGYVFGGNLPGPVVDGGFLFGTLPASAASPIINVASIQGYEITGGHSGAALAAATFVNVRSVNFSRNRVDTVTGNGVQITQRGNASGSGTLTRNGIFNTGGDAVNIDLADEASGSYTLSDSGYENPGGNVLRIAAADQSTYGVTFTASSASGLPGAAVFLDAAGDSNGTLTVRNSTLNEGGVDASLSGNAQASLAVSGMRIQNDPDSAFSLSADDSSSLTTRVRNNVIRNNQTAFSLEVSGAAVSDTVFSSNTIADSSSHAVSTRYEGNGSQELVVSGNEISSSGGDGIRVVVPDGTVEATVENNTVDMSTGRGMVFRTSVTGDLVATGSNNRITNADGGGILARATGSSELRADLTENEIVDSGSYGIRFQADNSATLDRNAAVRNRIQNAISAAIEFIANDDSLILQGSAFQNPLSNVPVGIRVEASDSSFVNQVINENTISDTTNEGIRFDGRDDSFVELIVSNNNVSSTGSASGIGMFVSGDNFTQGIVSGNVVGPTGQQGIELDSQGSAIGFVSVFGNQVSESSQNAIRVRLLSDQNQSVSIRENTLQQVGSRGINLTTEEAKGIVVYDNTIGTTGGPAVSVDMQTAGLILNGASSGDNIYTGLAVPFTDNGTAPFTGGDGVRINGTVYP